LEHRDGGRPPTRLTGTVRLDGRSDTLGVYADLTADSLSFDGLKGSFPALPLRGAVAGRVQLTGPLAALETHADLHSAGGAVQGDGVLLLGGKGARTGARDFTLHARDLDLARWLDRGPASLLTFSVEGSVVADGALPPVGALRARVAPSLFAGTPLDSGVAVVRFAERHLYVDSLRLAQPGLITTGSGALGWTAGARAVRLSARRGAGVRARSDARFPRAWRAGFRRRRSVGTRHARLAHLVRTLQGRRGRGLPRRRPVRAGAVGGREGHGRGHRLPRIAATGGRVGARAADRAHRDRLGRSCGRPRAAQCVRGGKAHARGRPADARPRGRASPAGVVPARGRVRAAGGRHGRRRRRDHRYGGSRRDACGPRVHRHVLAHQRVAGGVPCAVRGRRVRVPGTPARRRTQPLAIGTADPDGASAPAPGPLARSGGAPPAPRHALGAGRRRQR